MATSARTSQTTRRVIGICSVMGLLMFTQTACNLVPHDVLRQSQLRARQLYEQNHSLAMEADSLKTDNGRLQNQLAIANRRIDNLNSERSTLHQRYAGLLNKVRENPLSDDANRRLEELQNKYPGFEFDPRTGVSKFHSDILFDSGIAKIKSSALPVLHDFAGILNEGDAKRLNILVVGHTDDKPIAKPSTRSKHPTNWHLSTNRADSVVLELSKLGIKQNRMGAAGYSMYQPLVANTDEKARQKNRRVEIYVLAPDAMVAGWDPASSAK